MQNKLVKELIYKYPDYSSYRSCYLLKKKEKNRSKVNSPSIEVLHRYSGKPEFNLHAALTLGVRPPKLGLIEAVDAFGAVFLD